MALPNKPFAKIFDVLKTFAPTVAAGLGGPAGALVAGLIKQKFGGDAESDTESAVLSAASSPDQIIKLKELEQSAKALEQQLNIRFAELEVQDVESARAHEIAMAQQGDRTTRNVGYVILFAFLASAVGVLMGYAKVESALAGTIVGYLLGEARQVTSFYFGSSRGSRTKDAALMDIAKS